MRLKIRQMNHFITPVLFHYRLLRYCTKEKWFSFRIDSHNNYNNSDSIIILSGYKALRVWDLGAGKKTSVSLAGRFEWARPTGNGPRGVGWTPPVDFRGETLYPLLKHVRRTRYTQYNIYYVVYVLTDSAALLYPCCCRVW